MNARERERQLIVMAEREAQLVDEVARLRAVLVEAEAVVERHVPAAGDELDDESGICEASTLDNIRDVLAATAASAPAPREVHRLRADVERLTIDIGTIVRWWLIHMPRNTVQPSRELVNAIVAEHAKGIPADEREELDDFHAATADDAKGGA